MTIDFNCRDVSVSANTTRQVSVRAEDVDLSEILGQFTIKEIVGALDSGDLLDEIGVDKAIDHFDIEVQD